MTTTRRNRRIINAVKNGKTYKQIAETMGVTRCAVAGVVFRYNESDEGKASPARRHKWGYNVGSGGRKDIWRLSEEQILDMSEAVDFVSKATGVHADDITGKSRKQRVVQARRSLVIWLKDQGFTAIDVAAFLEKSPSMIVKYTLPSYQPQQQGQDR